MKSILHTFRLIALACTALIALALGPAAQAQFRDTPVVITNVVPATTTNTSPGTAIIDATRVKDVSVQWVLRLTGAGTTAIPFVVQRSVDGANWATAFSISLTPSGTNYVTTTTNINAQAFPYFRVYSIQNDNASAITNLAVTYGVKRNVD